MMRYKLLILLMLFAAVVSAQKVYVRGYVLNEDRRAVEFATVQIKETATGTITNEKGYFELSFTRQDSITLQFSCVGYVAAERRVAIGDELAYTVVVNLQTDTELLDEVEVKGYQRQTSTMMTLDSESLRLMPDASGGNIESLLTTFAGVSSNNEMSSQYSVRGGNYDENSVYVNGIEVYRPLLVRAGQQEGLSFINPDMVGEVNFSAGGFDAKYGDKMASVLDVTYKKPSEFEANLAASLQGVSAYVGASGKNFTQMHGVRFKTMQVLLGTLETKGEYSPYFVDYQTYMTWQMSKKWELTFLGNISQNYYNFTPKTRSTSFGTISNANNFTVFFDGKERDIFRTYFGALGFNYRPNKEVTLGFNVSAFNTNEQETYDITGEYWLSALDMSGGAQDKDEAPTGSLGTGMYHEHARNRLSATVINVGHTGMWKLPNNTLQWGVNYQNEIVLDRISEWETRDSAGYTLPVNSEQVEIIYNLYSDVDLYSHRMQVYVQDTYRHFADYGSWAFTAGVRANYWSFNNEFLVSPRATVAFFPDWKADLNFRLSAGVYHQAPFYKELRTEQTDELGNNYVALNKNIKAQRSLHAVFGMDYFFRAWNRPFKLTLEAYYKPSDRMISYYVDNVRVRYSGENDAVAYTAGVDVKLFGEFVPGTDSWISFSWMRSREDILDDHYSVYSNVGNYLGEVYPGYISRPNEQRYNISFFFQDYIPNHPEYKVHLKLVWSDGLPFGAPHSERYQAVLRTKAYNRVDIGASRGFVQGREKWMQKIDPVKNIWLSLELFNLFNIKNVNSYYWVTDIYNGQYAVPNYLTGFMVNFRVSVGF